MSIRIILDGRVVSESPEGINDLRASIKTDKGIGGRFLSEDATLTFYKDGYRYLTSLDQIGFCGEIEISIEEDEDDQAWRTIHDGIIHLPACEFGISPFYVKCPIDDNSFYARINKNKSIKYLLTSDRTKNDKPITPAAHDVVEFFRPSTGAYNYPTRWVYSAYEVFRYLIQAMSDNEVGFISDTFNPGGEFSEVGIIRGAELRAGLVNSHNLQPELSFDSMLEEMRKKYFIMLQPETSASGKPLIRIEAEPIFYDGSNSSIRLDYCNEIKRKVDTSRLYASISAGSEKTDDSSGAVQYPETTRWETFRKEQYPSLGQCNVDTELDLVSSFIISSNVIEQIVVNNITDFDDEIILVEYDPGTLKAKQSNWLTAGPPYFYNEGLKNDKVIERWLSGIPASIATFLGTGTDARFLAHQNSDLLMHASMAAVGASGSGFFPKNDFSGQGFDTGENYGDIVPQGTLISPFSKCIYTAPQGGFYRFSSMFHAVVHQHSFGSSGSFFARFKRKNSANVLISQHLVHFSIPPGITQDLDIVDIAEFGTLLNATDIVSCEWLVQSVNLNNPALSIDYTIKADSNFKCEFTSFGGGVWATVEEADFNAYQYAFRHPMTQEKFDRIVQNMSAAIFFNTDGITNYKAWIDQLTFYRFRGYADLILISSHRLKP